jgi:heme/copper-type cytochrome/quinol oxidase subunit 2
MRAGSCHNPWGVIRAGVGYNLKMQVAALAGCLGAGGDPMNAQTVPTQSDNQLIWLVVAVATLILFIVSVAYTALLLWQAGRVRRGDSPAEVNRRFTTHHPFSLPLNILIIGICGTVIALLLERMHPVLPAGSSTLFCFVPLAVSVLCAFPALMAILRLRTAIRRWERRFRG